MPDCCTTLDEPTPFPIKHTCPVNGKEYGLVSSLTIKHHIKAPWAWAEKPQGYYFCSDPDCDVVYFGQDDSLIEKNALRTEVGIKEKADNVLVCYCYGVTKAEAKSNPAIREFIIEETRQRRCACETRNPSGKCCLKDF